MRSITSILITICVAYTLNAQYFERSYNFIHNTKNEFFYESLQKHWNTLLAQKNIAYTILPSSIFRSSPTQPDITLIQPSTASIVLVIPQSPNPILMSIFEQIVDLITTGTLQNIALVPLPPAKDRHWQFKIIEKYALVNHISTIIWLDQTIHNGSLSVSKAHLTPPLHIAKSFLATAHSLHAVIPNSQFTGILNTLLTPISPLVYTMKSSPIPTLFLSNIPISRTTKQHVSNSSLTTESTITTDKWIHTFTSFIEAFSQSEQIQHPPPPETWQYQYLIVPFMANIIISENSLFLISFFILLITSAYGIFYRKTMIRYIKRIILHWDVITLLLLLLVAGFSLGHLTTIFLAQFIGLTAFKSLLIFKVLFSVLFSTLLYQHISYFQRFRGINRYLSAAALFMFIINFFLSILFSLSIVFYLAISFLAIFLFSLTKNIWIKTIWLCISLGVFIPIPLTYSKLPMLMNFLLFHTSASIIILPLITLPFFCMVVRIDHLIAPKKRYFIKIFIGIIMSIPLIFGIFTSIQSFLSGIYIDVTEYITPNTHYLVLKNNRAIGKAQFNFGNQTYYIYFRKHQEIIQLPITTASGTASIQSTYSEKFSTFNINVIFRKTAFLLSALLSTNNSDFILHYTDLTTSAPYGIKVKTATLTSHYPSQFFTFFVNTENTAPIKINLQAEYNTLSNTASFSNPSLHIKQNRKEQLPVKIIQTQ